jgi:hypothetical protein
MKRVALVLCGVILGAALVAAGGHASDGFSYSPIGSAEAAAPNPAPKKLAPPPDPLAGQNGAACIAIPVFSNQGQTRTKDCPSGYRIDSSKPGGVIVAYLILILRLLSTLIGGIIILMLVLAGVQYILSTGDPAKVKNAKKRVVNSITALVLFLMMYAILNFLIPGGVLK